MPWCCSRCAPWPGPPTRRSARWVRARSRESWRTSPPCWSAVVLIRMVGILVFRVLLPAVRVTPARIVEDLVITGITVAWGLVWLRLAGVDLGSLITTSAVITAVVAFSMQETLGNILGGVVLQLDQSIRVGDWVKLDDTSGRVVEIRWRYTAVETRNRETVVIPNGWLMKNRFTLIGSRFGRRAHVAALGVLRREHRVLAAQGVRGAGEGDHRRRHPARGPGARGHRGAHDDRRRLRALRASLLPRRPAARRSHRLACARARRGRAHAPRHGAGGAARGAAAHQGQRGAPGRAAREGAGAARVGAGARGSLRGLSRTPSERHSPSIWFTRRS